MIRRPPGRPFVLAHRGAPRDAPENTIAAFARAVELGVDGFETDVRRDAAGTLVLFHDRVTADGRAVAHLTAEEISAAAGHEVTPLESALARWPDAVWNLEIKDPAAARPTARLAERYLEPADALLTSYHHHAIAELSRETELPLGLLVSHHPISPRVTLCSPFRDRNTVRTLVLPAHRADKRLVETVARDGFSVILFGMVTEEEHERARALRPAGFVTDYPERLLR